MGHVDDDGSDECVGSGYEKEEAMTDRMGRVICNITISADGYVAGPNQSEERPFGDDRGDGFGDKLHAWMFENPEENEARWTRWPLTPQPAPSDR